MQADERVCVIPVAAGAVPPVHKNHVSVAGLNQRIGKRQPRCARPDYQIVGIYTHAVLVHGRWMSLHLTRYPQRHADKSFTADMYRLTRNIYTGSIFRSGERLVRD